MKTTAEILEEHQDRMRRIHEDGVAKVSDLGEKLNEAIAQEASAQVAARRAKLAAPA